MEKLPEEVVLKVMDNNWISPCCGEIIMEEKKRDAKESSCMV